MFSETLKQTLEERGLNVYRVSKATNIPLMTMYDWVNGKTKPSAENLYILAKYLDVTMEELME